MPNRKFKALVLDLFDTLVKWEPDRLPVMEWKGREMHSTMPWVLPKLAERLGDAFDQEGFIDVYNEVNTEVGVEREREGIEITCHERFARTLTRIVSAGGCDIHTFAEHLTRVHMAGVRSVTWAPVERVAAVKTLAPHYRLGLLSNFDDAQCGREVLLDTGVADLFEAVIISAEAGLRKPNPLIYQRILTMLHVEPRTILFVGDTPREDVLGPRQAAMRVAWVNGRGTPLPEGIPEPDLVIANIAELPALLGV